MTTMHELPPGIVAMGFLREQSELRKVWPTGYVALRSSQGYPVAVAGVTQPGLGFVVSVQGMPLERLQILADVLPEPPSIAQMQETGEVTIHEDHLEAIIG